MVPEELRYTQEHEWVSPSDAGTVRVGITDFAQSQLGDVVLVEVPSVGTSVTAGQSIAEIESTKSVSELYAPVGGTVTASNDDLGDAPELVNDDPYGAGWILEISPADPAEIESLLGAQEYQALIDEA